MAIANINQNGSVHRLESLTQDVEIGKDTFSKGEIAVKTIEECIQVLRSYRRKLDEYDVIRETDIRVVATSSVREASNRMTFVDRVYVATGLTVEILDAAEVHRITYRGVQPLLKAQAELIQSLSFVVEVGGGATEVLLLENGNVSWSRAYRLGSLRLQQLISDSHVPKTKTRSVMEGEIHSRIESLGEHTQQDKLTHMVAMGSDIRFACSEILGKEFASNTLAELSVSQLQTFTEEMLELSVEQIVAEYHLTFPEAETITPALLVNLQIAQMLNVDRILVSNVNLRDGLIHDISEGRSWTDDFRKQIIRSARELAQRYDVDTDHAQNVAELCRQLFHELRDEHQLDNHYETLLYVAALLHEIGGYVNSSSLHKHSLYLISNSDLFGLTSDDLQIVALTARYHRRAFPKSTHAGYSSLDRANRVAIAKMASILRIAIALDASRTQRIQNIECHKMRNRVVISVPSVDDLSVEQIALRGGRKFFQSIFGHDILLRSQSREVKSETSGQL